MKEGISLTGVKLLEKGTFNGFKFVEEDIQEIVDNTNFLIESKKLKQPSLKLGHSTNQILKGQSDGDPALGSLENIRLSEDNKLIADFKDVPDILLRAIQQGLYKQLSIELVEFKAFGWAMIAVAVIGADIPAVKTLEDLNQFLSTENVIPVTQEDFQHLNFSIKPLIIKEKMPEDTESKFAEMQAKLLKAENANNELLKEKKELQFKDSVNSTLAVFVQDVKDGKLQPAIFDKLKDHLNSQKANFMEGSALSFTAEIVHDIASAFSQNITDKETSVDSKDDDSEGEKTADVLFEEAVNEMIIKTGKEYIDASDMVAKANPTLIKSYVEYTASISDLGRN